MRTIVFAIFQLLATAVCAQKPPQEEVKAVVLSLFEGMRLGDSAMVHSTFMETAQMYTILRNKEGQPILRKGSLQKFLNAVGSTHDQVWNEPIWDIEVKIDQDFAQLWASYAFYAGNTFSHCGVDAFHLFRTEEGWKIFQITDTRKKEGCKIPGEIKDKFQ
ncbi:hypothetical protein FNH22_02325 [Fulvivirga sp. M361]|nr:hypothetical protein FNH22_02325 [Fulvivirga sp. M361]